MPSRSKSIAPALLLAALLAGSACDRPAAVRTTRTARTAAARPDFGPTAGYDRVFVFLGPGTEMPAAAVFDFTTLSDSSGVRRGERVRVLDGRDWIPLLDEGWRGDPLREPWRIVPHGSLKLIVGDGGEISALAVGGDPDVRLEPGATLAEDSPGAGTQLLLRQATLRVDGGTVDGVVLDAQLGRPVPEGLARDLARLAARSDSATEAALSQGGPSAVPGPDEDGTAIAWAGAQAFLLDNTGYYAVFVASADGDVTWIHDVDHDDVRRNARLEPTAWEDFRAASVQFPTAWRVSAPGEELAGELRAEAADHTVLRDLPGLSALGYVVVSGWIEDRGLRRGVFGLVRQVR